jgi:PIN domain nuclease of toxin-antitoxin system
MNLLLDTCTFLWLIANAPELSEKARDTFTNLDTQVYLSTISVWEITVKNALGKLPLPSAPEIFIP